MRRARRLPLEELAPYLWEMPKVRPGEPRPTAQPIDWQQVFGNDHPVEIEVGFGKGLFILNAALAFGCTFLVIFFSGFYEHGPKWIWTGFVPHGVPLWLAPLIWVIEFFGTLVKPFSLTVRLTANMTAGHIILAVLMGFLTIELSQLGASALGVYPASAFGYLAITAFEIAR